MKQNFAVVGSGSFFVMLSNLKRSWDWYFRELLKYPIVTAVKVVFYAHAASDGTILSSRGDTILWAIPLRWIILWFFSCEKFFSGNSRLFKFLEIDTERELKTCKCFGTVQRRNKVYKTFSADALYRMCLVRQHGVVSGSEKIC